MNQLPLPKKPPTFKQPAKTCPVCKRTFKYDPNKPFTTCSWKCQQAYKAQVEAIEAGDKAGEEYPF